MKAQLDTLTQCFANSMVLACPVLLASLNPQPYFHIIELVGIAVWLCAWFFENMADIQKHMFLRNCAHASRNTESKAEKESLKVAVLGYKPYDTEKYWLWTKCRHPNYFCEWMAWVGFAVMGVGSIITKDQWLQGGDGIQMTILLMAILYFMLRFFYGM